MCCFIFETNYAWGFKLMSLVFVNWKKEKKSMEILDVISNVFRYIFLLVLPHINKSLHAGKKCCLRILFTSISLVCYLHIQTFIGKRKQKRNHKHLKRKQNLNSVCINLDWNFNCWSFNQFPRVMKKLNVNCDVNSKLHEISMRI